MSFSLSATVFNKLKMSKTFIGSVVCQEFKLEAPKSEEMLDHVICSREQFSYQMCLESGDGSGTFCVIPYDK